MILNVLLVFNVCVSVFSIKFSEKCLLQKRYTNSDIKLATPSTTTSIARTIDDTKVVTGSINDSYTVNDGLSSVYIDGNHSVIAHDDDDNVNDGDSDAPYGVIRYKQHCTNLMAANNTPICNYPICSDFVCCRHEDDKNAGSTGIIEGILTHVMKVEVVNGDGVTRKKQNSCLEIYDAESIMKWKLEYEKDCIVHDSNGVKGLYFEHEKCPSLNSTNINEIPKVCDYDFCENWICCPTNDWPSAPRRAFVDSSFRHVEVVGDSCVDIVSGRSGVCRPPQQCPRIRTDMYEISEGDYNWTLCGYTECSKMICCPEHYLEHLSKSEKYCYQNLNTAFDIQKKISNIQPTHNPNHQCYAVSSIDGINVWPKEYSHMAAIGISLFNGSILYNCSGAIITDEFILSSSNCYQANKTIVHVGTLGAGDGIFPYFTCPKTFAVSEEFSNGKLSLLRLNRKIQFNTVSRPACLPTNGNLSMYNTLLTYNTATDKSFTLGGLLKLSIVRNNVIDNALEVVDGSVLQQYRFKELNVFSGDPLHYDDLNEYLMRTLVGIATSVTAKGEVVITKVFPYLDWISKIVF